MAYVLLMQWGKGENSTWLLQIKNTLASVYGGPCVSKPTVSFGSNFVCHTFNDLGERAHSFRIMQYACTFNLLISIYVLLYLWIRILETSRFISALRVLLNSEIPNSIFALHNQTGIRFWKYWGAVCVGLGYRNWQYFDLTVHSIKQNIQFYNTFYLTFVPTFLQIYFLTLYHKIWNITPYKSFKLCESRFFDTRQLLVDWNIYNSF